jgi:hypothetical protein
MSAYAITRGYGVELVTPYRRAFVDALKGYIPAHFREWDPDSRTWTLIPPYDVTGMRLAREHFGTVEMLAPSTGGTDHRLYDCLRRVQEEHPDYATLHLLPDAPVDVVKGAYRALALALHPDHAGPSTHERMVRINASYARLSAALKGAA